MGVFKGKLIHGMLPSFNKDKIIYWYLPIQRQIKNYAFIHKIETVPELQFW